MTRHKHRAVRERAADRPYLGPVSADENRAAHGGICRVDVCACGAQRRTNINGRHTERGQWAVQP